MRGSIASPGPQTVRYGGNTSCVYVQAGDQHIILDAGTGLRGLGLELMKGDFGKGKGEASFFVSHLHWDHVQGIPFFIPIYIKGNKFSFYSAKAFTPSLHAVLERQQSPPTFPPDADFRKLQSQLKFYQMEDGAVARLGAVRVINCRGNHPGGGYFYRIEHGGKVIVFATDYEHTPATNEVLSRFAKGADILIYDSQYTPDEYEARYRNWGHSTYVEGAGVARAAGVKALHMFHHDPGHDDQLLDSLTETAGRPNRSR